MNDKPNKQHEQRLIVVLVLLLLALCAAKFMVRVGTNTGFGRMGYPVWKRT